MADICRKSAVRFGYRRLTVMLRHEGWMVNPKRIYRLYTEDGVAVRTKVGKKIARPRTSTKAPSNSTQRKSGVWTSLRPGSLMSADFGC